MTVTEATDFYIKLSATKTMGTGYTCGIDQYII